jgi:hypothetical protein
MLKLQVEANAESLVHPMQIIDYKAFEEKFGKTGETELQTFEKFYAVRHLLEQGCFRIFVDASLITSEGDVNKQIILPADACGKKNNEVIVAFCETELPTKTLIKKLKILAIAENTRAVVLFPFTIDATELIQPFSSLFKSRRFTLEQVSWLNDESEEDFKNALDLVMVLGNRTRVKMLLPLLSEPRRKSHFRMHVNPKLVYENISMLVSHNLVEELVENEYDLTPIGKQVMGEYLAFLHKVKKILET